MPKSTRQKGDCTPIAFAWKGVIAEMPVRVEVPVLVSRIISVELSFSNHLLNGALWHDYLPYQRFFTALDGLLCVRVLFGSQPSVPHEVAN